MRKSIKYFSIIIFSIIALSSCEKDFLDIKPKGKVIPQSTDDYRKILDLVVQNNVGLIPTILRTYGITFYLSDDYQIFDTASYDALLTTDRYEKYTWAKDGYLYKEDAEDIDWQAMYAQIYIANSVINGVPDASGPESVKKTLIAEAKVHRAFCYLALVNIYAKHYSSSASSDLGVPLRLDILLTISLERATVEEVYDQIIKDLEDAAEDLPASQDYNHRPTKAAAYGLLARTYLYQGNYAEALNYANLCLDIQDHLYDLNVEMIIDTINDERYDGTNMFNFENTFTSWMDEEIILHKTTCTRTSGGSSYHYSYMVTTPEVVENLYDTLNDLRFRLKFEKRNEDEYYTAAEVGNRWSNGYYPVVGVTVPEILLTRAECNARLDHYQDAMDDINAIREKRLKSDAYAPLTASSREEAVEIVLLERRRELWGRGLRWFDLKRLNAIENANITIERSFTGQQLVPGDSHWVMPIANLYITQNPEIVQNEGY